LAKLFGDYYAEAVHLRAKYCSRLNILIGYETEWIRPSSLQLIQKALESYHFDFFVGSVHHVHTIPIDFDRKMYEDARKAAGGTDEMLFEDYFDAQYEMLSSLKPLIVGHFDLIRLLSDNRNGGFRHMEGVWRRITRNLGFINDYGGILELNSAALRKGMEEPYPCLEICQVCSLKLIEPCSG
jgi:histidinol-phosphatase (PHP family)